MSDNLEPFSYMRKLVMYDLKALNEDESMKVCKDFPVLGHRCGGIGLVRIANTGDAFWAVVECNAIQIKKCARHPQHVMSLYKTSHKTHYNLDCAVFMRCDEKITAVDDLTGNFTTCGYNIYPVYPFDKIQKERAEQGDEALKPIMFRFEEKYQQEQRRRGIV